MLILNHSIPYFKLKVTIKPDMVLYDLDLGTLKAESGRFLQIPGQLGLHSEILSQRKKSHMR